MKRTKVTIKDGRFPGEVMDIIRDADIYDSSCSEEASVFFIDKEGGLFLKEARAGSLKNEAALTDFFHSKGLSAEVLFYETCGDKDYMITRRIPGEDCTHKMYLGDPKRLCDLYAKLLRSLHETDTSGCPVKDRIDTYKAAVERGFGGQYYEPELFKGLWEFGSFSEALSDAREGIDSLRPEALIHGDYCLPNVILDDWKLSGYIDLGNGGIGDRHIDLLWGIWTLKYNLGTAIYTDRFIDASGRDAVDPEKLRMIAAMEMVGEA